MKKINRKFLLMLSFGLLVSVQSAFAEDTIEVNGTSFTCTNQCVVTNHGGGNFTVTDCCGGTVTSILFSEK